MFFDFGIFIDVLQSGIVRDIRSSTKVLELFLAEPVKLTMDEQVLASNLRPKSQVKHRASKSC